MTEEKLARAIPEEGNSLENKARSNVDLDNDCDYCRLAAMAPVSLADVYLDQVVERTVVEARIFVEEPEQNTGGAHHFAVVVVVVVEEGNSGHLDNTVVLPWFLRKNEVGLLQ